MHFRKVNITELNQRFFNDNEVYARIGNGNLSRVHRNTTIDIGDLYNTEFYVEVKEKQEDADNGSNDAKC